MKIVRLIGCLAGVFGFLVYKDGFNPELWTVASFYRSCFLVMLLAIMIDCFTPDRFK